MALFSPKQPADDGTVRPVIEALQREDAGTLAMTDEGLVDLSAEMSDPFEDVHRDATGAISASLDPPKTPAYSVMANSTWRMLEEQRAHSIDIVRECDAEIAKWTAKRDDAQRAADGCLAGQQAMGG